MTFHYRYSNGTVRVWLDGWDGDQFAVLSYEEFSALQNTMRCFSARFVEAED